MLAGRLGLALSLLMAAAQAWLLCDTAWDKSETPDEPSYIGGAIVQWSRHDFSHWPHCPVPKWGFGLALRVVEPWIAETPANGWRDAAHIHLFKHPLPRLRRNLMAARLATIAMTVLAGFLVRAAAGRFSPEAALLAHALWCFSPTTLAHGSLATIDAWLACLVALALWLTIRALERPSWPRALSLGGALGLALGVKIVAVVFVGAALLALGHRLGPDPRKWNRDGLRTTLRLWGAVLLGCVLSLWAVHLFAVGTLDTRQQAEDFGLPLLEIGLVPFPSWLEGVLRQVGVAGMGRRNYLFGVMQKEGWWWYYLAVLAFQVTVGGQVVGIMRLWNMVRHSRGRSLAIDLGLLLAPAILFTAFSASDNQAGVRYLLAVFPLVIVWASRVVQHPPSLGGLARAACVAAAVAGAAESVRLHPHHLMFFNVWAGGPEGGTRYLVESNDWGQDQRRLAGWQREGGPGRAGIFYAPYGDNPRVWGINYQPAPCSPRTGVFALHAAEVHRPKRVPPGCYDWLTVERPDDRIGYSIYIYFVNRERLARLAAQRGTPTPFFRGAPP